MGQRCIEDDIGKCLAQCQFQLVAVGVQRGVAGKGLPLLQCLQYGTKGCNAGHVFGTTAHAALLPTACHQCRVGRALAHIQHANALGGIQLVPRKRCVVDAAAMHVQFQFAQRLHAVHQPQRTAATGGEQSFDTNQITDHPGFVVGGHGAQQRGVRQPKRKGVQIVFAIGIHRQCAQFQAQAQNLVPVGQRHRHSLVFGRAIYQEQRSALQIAIAQVGLKIAANGAQCRQHGGLNAFGRAAGEQHVAIARTNDLRRHGPCLRQHFLGHQARRVAAAGVTKLLDHGPRGRRNSTGQYRRGGVGIQVKS